MNTVCASCQALNRLPDDRSADGAKCGRCGHDLFDGDVINATGATLDKLLKDDLPVVVDFWAPWCSYCRKIGPAYEKIGEEYADSLAVGKINIDEEPRLAGAEGIEDIPTLVLYRNGKAVDSIIAPGSKAEIDRFIQEALAK